MSGARSDAKSNEILVSYTYLPIFEEYGSRKL